MEPSTLSQWTKEGFLSSGQRCLRGINSSCSWTAGIQVVQLRSILRENILNYKTILREKYTQIKGQLSKPVCTMCTMSQVCKVDKTRSTIYEVEGPHPPEAAAGVPVPNIPGHGNSYGNSMGISWEHPAYVCWTQHYSWRRNISSYKDDRGQTGRHPRAWNSDTMKAADGDTS